MKKIADSLSIENKVPKKLFLCNKWIKKVFVKKRKGNFKRSRENYDNALLKRFEVSVSSTRNFIVR